MMPRVRRFARLLLSLALPLSWAAGGWAAACAERPSAAAADAHAMAHHAHGGMHHHLPPAPRDRAPRGEMPSCPLLAMNGGTCLGAAHLPTVVAGPSGVASGARGYPPADGIRDRLLPLSFFRPPEA